MQLTPEQINDFIAKAVMESQIGQATTDAITKQVAALSKSYDNPFDSVIRQHVVKFIDDQLLTVFRPKLEERVKAAMATALTDEILDNIVRAAADKLRTSRY